jgi:hypothetical protein
MMTSMALTVLALIGSQVSAQMVQVDSTEMTLVSETVSFPMVSGIQFDTNTFTWTSVEGEIVVGDMDVDMETGTYGSAGDSVYGGYGFDTTGTYGTYGPVGTASTENYYPYSITLSTESGTTVDGMVSPLTASILTVSMANDRCRSAAELSVTMDLILEIDPDCVFEWITRFEVGSSTREVILQTINDSLPGRVNLGQFIPDNTSFFMADDNSDGSAVNVFRDTVSITTENLLAIASLLNAPVCVPTYSECTQGLECCDVGAICMKKNEFYSQCRPADSPFARDMCMCPCDRPERS